VGVFGKVHPNSNTGQFTGLAARFEGPVVCQGSVKIQGPLTVRGNLEVIGGTKSAAVAHPDGSRRLLYAVESPESWFEDFGEGKLKSGKAVVKLDRAFASLIRLGDYHVFLTPRGDCNGLYVTAQTSAGFTVRETNDGNKSISFSYRVVAKRKDVTARRLEKLKESKLPPSPARPIPKVREVLKKPELVPLPEIPAPKRKDLAKYGLDAKARAKKSRRHRPGR
jgi:hypothetical protein